jgi:4-hydroxy-tetrahydrodipicolinate synthase
MTSLRLSENARGVFPISATPFTDDGALDLASVETLTDFYLRFGIDGLTILGIMGEAHKLSSEESVAVIERVAAVVAGRFPIVVGVSNPGVATLAGLAHKSMELGAAGVMVAPVQGLRTDEQIFNYFSIVIAALGKDVPVVLQDYPQTTGVYMSASLIARMLNEFVQIVMLKHEDSPGLNKLSRLRKESADGKLRRTSILVGNNGLHLPQEMARGADGAMTGFAFPEMLVDVCRLYASGDAEGGEDIYDAYLPLVRQEAQLGLGLALRKEVLRRRGAIRSAHVREPGPKLSALDMTELDGLIARLERKLERMSHRMRLVA